MENFALHPEELDAAVRLEDMRIRERQLETHLLQSPDYLQRARRELTWNVAMLYAAIALLILSQGLFTWKDAARIPPSLVVLNIAASLLAIINCLLIIRTKKCLRRLNSSWLQPAEKSALESIRKQTSSLFNKRDTTTRIFNERPKL